MRCPGKSYVHRRLLIAYYRHLGYSFLTGARTDFSNIAIRRAGIRFRSRSLRVSLQFEHIERVSARRPSISPVILPPSCQVYRRSLALPCLGGSSRVGRLNDVLG